MIWAPTFVDFESRSRADLDVVGGRRYWDDPSSEVICACLCLPAGLVGPDPAYVDWLPGDPAPPVLEAVAAHNWHGFDRFAWRRLGWPEPAREIDTAWLAKRMGMRAALDELMTKLLGRPKDHEGSKLTRGLSSVRRPPGVKEKRIEEIPPALRTTKAKTRTRTVQVGGILPAEWATFSPAEKRARGLLPEISAEVLQRVQVYCRSDVAGMAEAWPQLAPWAGVEPEVAAADVAVNDRGVCFDRELAQALLEVDARMCAEALAAAGVRAEQVRSNDQFRVLIREAGGPDLPDAKAESVIPLLSTPGRVGLIAEARFALASIARGKLEAGLASCSADGRLREMHNYHAAHTARWAGQRFQTQNIPWIDKRAQG